MPDSIDVLERTYLTVNVQELETPPGVLTGLLTPTRTTSVDTEAIEYGHERRNRETAPFSRHGSEPPFVGDRVRGLRMLRIPYIGMQKTIRAGDYAHDRRGGQRLFTNGEGSVDRLAEMVDTYQLDMRARLDNTIEWWYSQMIRGTVSYADANYESFTYDFGRSASHEMTAQAGQFWDGGGSPDEIQDFQDVKSLVANDAFTNVTVGLCAPDVAAHIRKSAFFLERLDKRNVDEDFRRSYIDVNAPYSNQGALTPIGRFAGIELWEYNRSLPIAGVSTPMIRPKHIEFLSMGSELDIEQFFGPLYDFDVRGGAPILEPIYSKSWDIKHPSQRRIVVESRPLVAPKRPDVFASMQVLQ